MAWRQRRSSRRARRPGRPRIGHARAAALGIIVVATADASPSQPPLRTAVAAVDRPPPGRARAATLALILAAFRPIRPAAGGNRPPPNFVLILTDDLDQTLGGATSTSLVKTRRLLADAGAALPRWCVHTPVCCPSRSEILTGRMFHNLRIPDGNVTSDGLRAGCMHVDVAADPSHPFYSRYYFAPHFHEAGYTVGVFGKHLNNYNLPGCPPGVDRWMVNGGGSYLDPSFSWASSGSGEPKRVTFDNCTDAKTGEGRPCYSTSVIGNASIAWIRDHLARSEANPPKPFFSYVSVKAPHLQDGPNFPMAIPAPWYANASVGVPRAPRTSNYNASCLDHHWLVRSQPPLTTLEGEKVDELYVSRLRTLLSVDDLVEEMVVTLDDLGVLDNTYLLFTSDNGYRLGQFRMPQGKFHPYENDVLVPLWIRGPGIRPGSVRDDVLGTHVDLMPTLLGLAGIVDEKGGVPPTMDGTDLSPELLGGANGSGGSTAQRRLRRRPARRRKSVLIEYIGLGPVVRYGHLEDSYNNTYRALRVYDPTASPGWRNMKYVEFTDCRSDWNFTGEPREAELFDLDEDPYEMVNLVSTVPEGALRELREVTRTLFSCAGPTCREAAWNTSVVAVERV